MQHNVMRCFVVTSALWFMALLLSPADGAIDPTVLAELLSLYSTTNGRYWTNQTNWLDPKTGYCSWFGVTCDTDGNVVDIRLPNNNLTGAQLSALNPNVFRSLRGLDVSGNELEGMAPVHLLTITTLTTLNLASNRFERAQLSPSVVRPNVTGIALSLADNPYRCPLYGAITELLLLTALDRSGVSCRKYTQTRSIVLEAPVTIVPSVASGRFYGVLLRRQDAVSTASPVYVQFVVSVLTSILHRQDAQWYSPIQLLNVTTTSVMNATVWYNAFGVPFVACAFNQSATTTVQRADLLSRLLTGHDSIGTLDLVQVIPVSDTVASFPAALDDTTLTQAPLSPAPNSADGIKASTLTFIIVGAVGFAVLLVGCAYLVCTRRHFFMKESAPVYGGGSGAATGHV